MLNFQYTFETRKRSFIRAFSICITVPLKETRNSYFCVTPKNHRLMLSHENIKKHRHKKSNCIF